MSITQKQDGLYIVTATINNSKICEVYVYMTWREAVTKFITKYPTAIYA